MGSGGHCAGEIMKVQREEGEGGGRKCVKEGLRKRKAGGGRGGTVEYMVETEQVRAERSTRRRHMDLKRKIIKMRIRRTKRMRWRTWQVFYPCFIK